MPFSICQFNLFHFRRLQTIFADMAIELLQGSIVKGVHICSAEKKIRKIYDPATDRLHHTQFVGNSVAAGVAVAKLMHTNWHCILFLICEWFILNEIALKTERSHSQKRHIYQSQQVYRPILWFFRFAEVKHRYGNTMYLADTFTFILCVTSTDADHFSSVRYHQFVLVWHLMCVFVVRQCHLKKSIDVWLLSINRVVWLPISI